MPSALPGSYKPVPFRATVVDFRESRESVGKGHFIVRTCSAPRRRCGLVCGSCRMAVQLGDFLCGIQIQEK